MSLRRQIGDVVQLNDDGSPYEGRIVAHGRGVDPDDCVRGCGDPLCREWPVVEVLDARGKATGERVFHVAECLMTTPASATN